MSNLTDAFAKADKTRRTQRDDKRQSFFADLGLNVFHDPFELNLDPAAQLSVAKNGAKQSGNGGRSASGRSPRNTQTMP